FRMGILEEILHTPARGLHGRFPCISTRGGREGYPCAGPVSCPGIVCQHSVTVVLSGILCLHAVCSTNRPIAAVAISSRRAASITSTRRCPPCSADQYLHNKRQEHPDPH